MADEWTPPRCAHGNILLGCPIADCEEQNAYLKQQQEAIDRYLTEISILPDLGVYCEVCGVHNEGPCIYH